MPTAARNWTKQMVWDLPDDRKRYEVVDGELLVTPSTTFRHQAALSQFMIRLALYLGPLGRLSTLYPGPADISWVEDVLVKPDIFVAAPGEVSEDWSTIKTLLLAVEVVSPNTDRADRVIKRAVYQRYGVATYWVVDPDAQAVEVWHPGDAAPLVVRDVLRWQVALDAPVLEIVLAELFARLPR